MKRKSNSGERGKEKKIRKGEKAQIFWEGRKNIPAVTGKFSERNQTSTDLEEKEGKRRIRRVGRVDIIARSGESVRYSCYETRVRPSVVNDQLWLATRTRPWRWPTFGPPRLLRRSSTKGTSVGWILFSPLLIILQRVAVCVYAESRMKRAPLSSFVRVPPPPSGNKPPKKFRKLDRVYTVERLHAKIGGDWSRFRVHIYIYIYFLFVEKFPFEFLLSREMHERKKVRTFPFVRDLYNSRENSRSRSRKVVLFSNCDRPIKPINFYGLTMLNSMFENWGNGTEGERGIWNARLNLNRSTR